MNPFDRKVFFDECRKGVMGPTIDKDELTGAEAILDAMAGLPVPYIAYALATAWHETAHKLQPIKEYGGRAYFHRMYDIEGRNPRLAKRLGNIHPGDGAKFAGRGYVQLTGRDNYIRAGKKIGADLVANPDLAMSRSYAARIMREGMIEGWFTGKSFKSYLPKTFAMRAEFVKARRIINGTDKASLIAGYALQFQTALTRASR